MTVNLHCVLIGALACGLLAAAPSAARAQDDAPQAMTDAELIGDPEEGRALAGAVCAECHGIAPGVSTSPLDDATAFAELAQIPAMTSRALTVWLTTFHPERTMPGIVLATDERENIIAYILSLRQGED